MNEKKIYVPSADELYTMQDMGANIYKYLLVKAIETIAMEGVKYPGKGMLKNIPSTWIDSNPYIEYAICMMYPEELKYSSVASSEPFIFEYLINKEEDKSIYNLDSLVYASNSALNDNIKRKIIEMLESKLKTVPQYRFEYKDFECIGKNDKGFPVLSYNKLLNDIFSCNCSMEDVKSIERLINIEPAYALKYKERLGTDSVGLLRQGVNGYGLRYGIGYDDLTEYRNEDILTNPDDKVKRLVRCINEREKKIKL